MKKLIFTLLLALAIFAPTNVRAEDEVIICPQPYGGGVVCGVKTHEPVDAGIGENMALIGILSLGASGILLRLSKKSKLSA